jgi:hypothetical protein
MAKLLAACVALAALSLLLPSEPSYDPFTWLVWGREIAHGELDTTGGSSWKPLPAVFTTLFAPLSKVDDAIPVALWMLVARTGALLALALAFRLAARLAGGGVDGGDRRRCRCAYAPRAAGLAPVRRARERSAVGSGAHARGDLATPRPAP